MVKPDAGDRRTEESEVMGDLGVSGKKMAETDWEGGAGHRRIGVGNNGGWV